MVVTNPLTQHGPLFLTAANFANAPVSMRLKSAGASLNISTLISLQTYGYKNVYELGGYIDVNQSKLPFAGSDVKK